MELLKKHLGIQKKEIGKANGAPPVEYFILKYKNEFSEDWLLPTIFRWEPYPRLMS